MIKHTPKNIQNFTFDPKFGVLAVELLGYDATNNVLRRLVVDSNGILQKSSGTSRAGHPIGLLLALTYSS